MNPMMNMMGVQRGFNLPAAGTLPSQGLPMIEHEHPSGEENQREHGRPSRIMAHNINGVPAQQRSTGNENTSARMSELMQKEYDNWMRLQESNAPEGYFQTRPPVDMNMFSSVPPASAQQSGLVPYGNPYRMEFSSVRHRSISEWHATATGGHGHPQPPVHLNMGNPVPPNRMQHSGQPPSSGLPWFQRTTLVGSNGNMQINRNGQPNPDHLEYLHHPRIPPSGPIGYPSHSMGSVNPSGIDPGYPAYASTQSPGTPANRTFIENHEYVPGGGLASAPQHQPMYAEPHFYPSQFPDAGLLHFDEPQNLATTAINMANHGYHPGGEVRSGNSRNNLSSLDAEAELTRSRQREQAHRDLERSNYVPYQSRDLEPLPGYQRVDNPDIFAPLPPKREKKPANNKPPAPGAARSKTLATPPSDSPIDSSESKPVESPEAKEMKISYQSPITPSNNKAAVSLEANMMETSKVIPITLSDNNPSEPSANSPQAKIKQEESSENTIPLSNTQEKTPGGNVSEPETCAHCGLAFPDLLELASHLVDMHNTRDTYDEYFKHCVCGMTFDSIDEWIKHDPQGECFKRNYE